MAADVPLGLRMLCNALGVDPEVIEKTAMGLAELAQTFENRMKVIEQQNAEILSLLRGSHERSGTRLSITGSNGAANSSGGDAGISSTGTGGSQ